MLDVQILCSKYELLTILVVYFFAFSCIELYRSPAAVHVQVKPVLDRLHSSDAKVSEAVGYQGEPSHWIAYDE